MNPDAALMEIRTLAEYIQAHADSGTLTADDLELADDLSELILALDQWLTRGGFRPRAWN